MEWADWLSKVNSFVGGVTNKRSDDLRPFVNVTVLGHTFQALVDTGSVVNLIGSKIARYLERNHVTRRGAETELRMADGSICLVNEIYQIDGLIDNRPYSWDVCCVPGLASDMILGISCIRDLNLLEYKFWQNNSTEPSANKYKPGVSALSAPSTPGEETELKTFLDYSGESANLFHDFAPRHENEAGTGEPMELEEEVDNNMELLGVDKPVSQTTLLDDGSASPCLSLETSDVDEHPNGMSASTRRHKGSPSDQMQSDHAPVVGPAEHHPHNEEAARPEETLQRMRRTPPAYLRSHPHRSPTLLVTVGEDNNSPRRVTIREPNAPGAEPKPGIPPSVLKRLEATYDRMTPTERRKKKWRIFLSDGSFVRLRPAALKRLMKR